MPNENNFFTASTSDAAFIAHYNKFIAPYIEEYEAKRIKAFRYKQLLMHNGTKAALAICGFLLFFTSYNNANGLLLLFGLLMLLLYSLFYLLTKSYKKSVITKIYPAIFNYYGDCIKFYPVGLPPIRDLRFEGLLSTLSTCESRCYLRGAYKEVKFEILEVVHTFNPKTSQGEDNQKYISPKRYYLCISMNKTITGTTILLDDMGAFLNNMMKNALEKNGKCESVQLEDTKFDSKFEIYSSDQVEARYLLTPSFMERILSINLVLGGRITAAFHRGNLLLYIDTTNWLPPPPLETPVTFLPESEAILQQMNEIARLIDVLQLDKKIGL